MKIAILGDTHFGVRNGSKSFNAYFEKFYSTIFFPYLVENNIKHIIQLGDIFDNRNVAHINGFAECKRYFFDRLSELDINLITLVGNHDSFYKDTISINSPNLLLEGKFDRINVVSSPQLIEIFPEIECVALPWICRDNEKETFSIIESSKNSVCFGHLELKDFPMHKGIMAEEGMEASIFERFEYVFSGHYHHRSNKGNIYYIGTPYELTWHDDSDPKGFHIFDFESMNLEFVANPYKMFNKIYYDDVAFPEQIKLILENSGLEEYSNCYLKLIVKNKSNPHLFDLFLDYIYKINPIDLVIIEDMGDLLSENPHDVDESEDTLTILNKYVDNIATKELDSNKLKGILSSLYEEAMNLDSV